MQLNPTRNRSCDGLRIINLFGDGGRYAGQIRRADAYEMHFSMYSYDDYISVDPSGLLCRIDRIKFNETLENVYSGYFDACACDSNDALLMQFAANRKGMKPLPFIINEVDCFQMAGWVRRFIQQQYNIDCFPDFINAPQNFWMYISSSRKEIYLSMGLHERNLFYLPMSTASIEFPFPGFFGKITDDLHNHASPFRNKIISIGTHNRDFKTLARAISGTGLEAHIITNLRINHPQEAPGIYWHDSMPESEYLRATRDAKCVVLPLRDSPRAAGQMSCAIPMKWGVAVVATESEALRDHIIHDETGFLYQPGSYKQLRSILMRISESPNDLRRVQEKAQKREKELSAVAARNLKRLIKRLRHS